MMKNSNLTVPVLVISCVVILCCCLCGALVVSAGLISATDTFDFDPSLGLEQPAENLPTPVVIRPEADVMPGQNETIQILETAEIPVNDLAELAARLNGVENIPAMVERETAAPLEAGATDQFWVTDTDTNESFQIDAVLGYVTEHAYFWFQDGIRYDETDLVKLADTFENQIYPTNRAFFGSEWSPGIDNDPHLYIIFARGIGTNLAGYFSSADEYHPLAHEYSNAHEVFLLNYDNLGLDEHYTYGVLAHEFQHMIHWFQDRNETSWLNEGFSELASFLNGYDAGGFDRLYANTPDLQLNDWPNDPNKTSAHYGASFLYVTYFLDRFGEDVTQSLVGHPANGMVSIDAVLTDRNITDPVTQQAITADDVFLDWTLAMYLKDDQVGDGRYFYSNYPTVPKTKATETMQNCPAGPETRAVHQYGVDYIRIACEGAYTLRFEGSVQVGVLPVDAYSGNFAFWSNKSDESNMMLTQSFDFSDHSGPLSLSYYTWYDIETDYDYVFVEASTDGQYWEILKTPSSTDEDPSGNSFGWGYNGLSGGDGRWIQEMVDLSQFAGQQVQIRFEYVTDAAVNGEGFLIDDIAIPEIGYFSDFEMDAGGWDAAGFVRIQNALPQNFRLALIHEGPETWVEYLTVTPDNMLEVPIVVGEDADAVTLVVTGTTRYTRQKATYRYEVLP